MLCYVDISKLDNHRIVIVRIQIQFYLEMTIYLLGFVEIFRLLMMALLDMTNIPNQTISGVSTEELQWITEESSERMIKELDIEMFKDLDTFMDENENQYQELPNKILNELIEAEKSNTPKVTQSQTNAHIRKLKLFLKDNGLSEDIENMPVRFLADYLRYFYYTLKCKDGSFYAPRSLVSIRASIHRYLTSPMVNRNINVLNDQAFNRANAVLRVMVGKWMEAGNKAKQFPAIEPEDMSRIHTYFNRQNPRVLQHEVWFNCTYYFGMRGREVISKLKTADLDFASDSEAREYVFIKHDFLSKNVKKSLSQKEFENVCNARMYANTDQSKCPVQCIRLYFSKIPDTNSNLFPMINNGWMNSRYWYTPSRNTGKNMLGKFMKDISTDARLTKIYTNHSVRVTVVTELHAQGFSHLEICNVTGHKNPESVSRYVRETRDESRKVISDALNRSLTDAKHVTVTRKRQNTEIQVEVGDTALSEDKVIKITTNAPINFNGQIQNCYVYNHN